MNARVRGGNDYDTDVSHYSISELIDLARS
jgi:hypothetical protein